MPSDPEGNGRVRPRKSRQYGEFDLLSPYWRLGRIRYIGYSFLYSVSAALTLGILTLALSWLPPSLKDLAQGFTFALVTGVWAYLTVVLTIKRCHDFDINGWFSLLLLLPAGVFAFWLIPGTDGVNRYGRDLPPNTPIEKLLAIVAIACLTGGILFLLT